MTADTQTPEDLRALVLAEQAKSLSHREFAHRMKGFGFQIEQTARGLAVKNFSGSETVLTL